MSRSTEKVIDRSIKYGAVFAEVGSPICKWDQENIDILQFNPFAKAAFGFASVTVEVCAHYYCRIRSRDNA